MFDLGLARPGVEGAVVAAMLWLAAAAAFFSVILVVGQAVARRRRGDFSGFLPRQGVSPVLIAIGAGFAALALVQALSRAGMLEIASATIDRLGL